jgi:death on curing protein
MIKPISIEEVEFIALEMARQTMTWNEPIPSFETRYPGRLESCLALPFQTFDKKLLYKGLSRKAAILFYLMIKNHPFENGNKRIAVTTLICFLMKNGKWLTVVNHEDLYRLAVTIAESDPSYKDQYVEIIISFIERHLK